MFSQENKKYEIGKFGAAGPTQPNPLSLLPLLLFADRQPAPNSTTIKKRTLEKVEACNCKSIMSKSSWQVYKYYLRRKSSIHIFINFIRVFSFFFFSTKKKKKNFLVRVNLPFFQKQFFQIQFYINKKELKKIFFFKKFFFLKNFLQ